jgi:hypothetical protein
MHLILFQIIVGTGIAAYLFQAWRRARRRNARSWEAIVMRMQQNWSARELSARDVTPEDTGGERWQKICGARGLRAMYGNAGVLLELADYVARNGSPSDLELVAELRSEAYQIRISLIQTVVSYALHTAQEGVWMHMLRAEQAYAELELRITELLEVRAGEMVSAFVEAS